MILEYDSISLYQGVNGWTWDVCLFVKPCGPYGQFAIARVKATGNSGSRRKALGEAHKVLAALGVKRRDALKGAKGEQEALQPA